MSYALLVKKLERMGGSFISRKELKKYCEELGMGYNPVIRYLTSNKYLVRILRGVFYVKSIEERKLDTVRINHLEAIKKALSMKGVGNWYFGLDTAISLNNLTHEYYTITFVLSDSLSRPKPFDILGHKVKFIKVSEKLFGFGVITGDIPYSDPEKTLLDTIYLGRYNSLTKSEMIDKTIDIVKHCSKNKLKKYAVNYPKTVKRIMEEIL